jgi:hypothetical protein
MDVEGAVKVRFSQLPADCGCPSVWQTVHRPDIGSSVSDKLTALFLGSLIFVGVTFRRGEFCGFALVFI